MIKNAAVPIHKRSSINSRIILQTKQPAKHLINKVNMRERKREAPILAKINGHPFYRSAKDSCRKVISIKSSKWSKISSYLG